MDLSKLTNGQRIGLIGGIVVIINLFFPWFGISAGGFGSASGNAFDFGMAWLGSLLVIAGAVILGLKAFGTTDVKIGALKAEQIALLLAGLGTIFVVLQLIIGHDAGGVLNLDRKFGVFLGPIAAIATTAGAFMAMQEAGISMPTAEDFKSLGGGGDDDDAPPPPPPA
jgi:hypothetical protein